jgi:predicted GNAT superfamily acetyltransferase
VSERPISGAREIEVRHCASLAEYEECVNLQRITWGKDILVPSAMFVVARHTGGQTLGAFDGTKMGGFTYAVAGVREGQPFLHSHMTAVLPEYRDRGVGRRLKMFQRQDALKHGIELIEWTFDPLELKNARFSLVRLGVVLRRFIPNCYGITDSPLHAGLPTDRFVAEWWLDSERVKDILANNPPPVGTAVQRISLPADIGEIKAKNRDAAAHIQSEVREQFEKAFADGYVATGFEMAGATAEYILEPVDAIAGLHLPPFHED